MQTSFLENQKPLLLIDESLADYMLAQVLRLVDYNAVAVREQFGEGAQDPILIRWLGLQRGVWITSDERAKWEHSHEIKDAGIHILWVRRPKNLRFGKKAQLLLILWVIDPVLQEIVNARGPAQFRARYSGERPRWERL
ncbi:MAG: hypothetical protein DDT28_00199 [Dehalococcoidia bacterium]|nr:hypothetical protein [Chloroflexota bacterium]